MRLDKISTNFGSNLSEGSVFGTSCPHEGLKYVFHAPETDLPLLFPQIEHLLMYTKSPLKWKLCNRYDYWSFVSELHYCSILKINTGPAFDEYIFFTDIERTAAGILSGPPQKYCSFCRLTQSSYSW